MKWSNVLALVPNLRLVTFTSQIISCPLPRFEQIQEIIKNGSTISENLQQNIDHDTLEELELNSSNQSDFEETDPKIGNQSYELKLALHRILLNTIKVCQII